jgi:general L-amino acid transport system substrate-binding protein
MGDFKAALTPCCGGSYAESGERNVGAQSPLKFARGVNTPWNAGGALYPLPMH